MIEYRRGSRFVEGGSSELFLGVAVGLGGFQRRVVLKAVRADQESESAQRGRLAGEARLLSQLHHPGVIEISDFVELEGRMYQVLEHLDGKDLRAWAAEAEDAAVPFAAAAVLHVIRQLALTLEYVHEARDHEGRALGIIHRDLSPGNVVLTHAGEVKLIDFGIARWRDQDGHTKLGETVGTPGFMAPEQLAGGPLDARADLYSLGCLAHWMLTGESPAAGPEAEARLLAGHPPGLSPRLPPAWRPLLERALEANPARRFPSAAVFGSALGQVSSGAEAQTEGAVRAWPGAQRVEASPGGSPADLWRVGWEATGSVGELAAPRDRPPTAMASAPEPTVATVANAARDSGISFVRPSTMTRPEDFTAESESDTQPDEEDTGSKTLELEDTTARSLTAAPSHVELPGPGPMPWVPAETPPVPNETPPRISITPPRVVEHTEPSPLRLVAMALIVFGVAFGASRFFFGLGASASGPAPAPEQRPRLEQLTATPSPVPAVEEPPTPVARLEPEPAPSPPEGEAAPEVPRPPRRKPPRSAPGGGREAAAPPTPEEPAWSPPIVVWSLDQALDDKGLPKSGLEWLDAEQAAVWRRCLRERDAACLERVGPQLIVAVERSSIDVSFLSRQLEALEASLRQRSTQFEAAELEALDQRLLDLKLLARQSPDRRQLRRALEEVRSLQLRLRRAR